MSSFIPESAPFSEEQRSWLNGFFSGLMGIDSSMSPGDALAAAGIATESIPPAGHVEEEEEDFPWHDSALPIIDRMELAEGKPLKSRLMAAMAQLDCGSCGYLCDTYSEAIASGEENNLTLCSPGGKETKKMIKKLLKENDGEISDEAKPATNGSTTDSPAGWSRKNPYSAKLVESRALNGEGSAKDTRHVVIDLNGSGINYEVGDALGIFPSNCPDLAEMIITRLGAESDLNVDTPMGSRKSLALALKEDCCLRDPSDELVELMLQQTDSRDVQATLTQFIDEGVPEGHDVLDILGLAGDVTVTATEFMATLGPLNPRLYSIASSMKKVGGEVHLTVGKVDFQREGRVRKGVASTMLSDRLASGDTCRVFVQPNHGGFTVPADPSAPMIMVGPGTGIAPFVAFLQEREAAKSSGDNWLFFGDQHAATDFLYEEMLKDYEATGLLNRLDIAFSRDGDDKVYVQDRMRENAAELWRWIQRGACLFVCGDAKRMANDVNEALIEIISQEADMSAEDAKKFVAKLQADKRYVRDVY